MNGRAKRADADRMSALELDHRAGGPPAIRLGRMSARYKRVVLWVLLVTALSHARAAHVILHSGRRIAAERVEVDAEGVVTVTTPAQQVLTFQPGQFREVFVEKPQMLVEAEAGATNRVELLRAVQRDFRFLEWEAVATRLLADDYFEQGDFRLAAEEYARLEDDAEVQDLLRTSLLRAGDLEQLNPLLEQDISAGSREQAAQAYLLRGDLKRKAGDREGARRDYLKVTLFFRAQREVVEVAEARLVED